MLEYGGARDLLRKAFAKPAAHRASRIVGSHRKIKGGIDAVLLEQRSEARHALPRAAQGVHIDLQADAGALKHRATRAPTPTADCVRRNRKSRSMPRACRSWASIRVPRSCS